MLRVGVDIGGTFTDLIAFDDESRTLTPIKVPSTPRDPTEGVAHAVDRLAAGDAAAIGLFIHASTIGTNLFLGQVGLDLPRAALLTTEGFRDVLEIGRQRRAELYNPFYQRPRPLVDRRLRLVVRERVGPHGEVLVPLDEKAVRAAADRLAREGVGVVAVAFLHAYINPAHERRAKAILRQRLPGAVIVASHEVNPEYREYERTSTTVVNAMLAPVVSTYLRRLEGRLREAGVTAPVLVMQSNGGLASIDLASGQPAATIESGPAAGVVASTYLGQTLGLRDLLSFDMGGTTAKAGAVRGGAPQVVTEYEVGGKVHTGRIVKGSGYPVRYPFIDLAEVSAGGGTIAWLDRAGALRVGPVSAGADPGPACYGGGGEDPTVTDCNLLLGRLNPETLLGGEMSLRRDLAERALMDRIARPLGLGREEAASGILRVVNAQMVRALRIVSVERGYDPRAMTMVAFGGAGPMHGAFLAEELGIEEVIVPPSPGLFSAMGLVVADLRHDYVRSLMRLAGDVATDRLEAFYRELEREAEATLAAEGVDGRAVALHRMLDLRYLGQSYELSVDGPRPASRLADAVETFHRRHREMYGYAVEGEPVEVVNLRVVAVGTTAKPPLPAPSRDGKVKPGRRRVYVEQAGWVEAGVYWRPVLSAEAAVPGPAVIEAYDATVVVPPGWRAQVDGQANLRLRRA